MGKIYSFYMTLLFFSTSLFSIKEGLARAHKVTDQPETWVTYKIARGALLRKYNPTPDRCRPPVRWIDGALVKVPPHESLTASPEPEATVACMVKEYKKVAFDMTPVHNFSPVLKTILAHRPIHYLRYTCDGSPREIWYTPDAEKEGLLLLHAVLNPTVAPGFSYLCGSLIGYTPEDIYAFYVCQGEGHLFNAERDEVELYIHAYADTIQQWFYDHKDLHAIESGRLGHG